MDRDGRPAVRGYGPLLIEGRSSVGFSDATDHAIARAFEAAPEIGWYEVERLYGDFLQGEITVWKVAVTVGPPPEGEDGRG